jgi:thiamine-phosphate pyrophosphorylase
VNGTARVVDVNLNRLAEALKVVEDLCRFELDDRQLVREVRRMRAQFQKAAGWLRRHVLPFRASRTDLGRAGRFDRTPRSRPDDVLRANLKRIQESARILEEMTRLDYRELFPEFKALRFAAYDLELEVAARVDRRPGLRLYVVLDTAMTGRTGLSAIARQLARNRVNAVQLREPPGLSTRDFLRDALTVRQALKESPTAFIVNNRVDIALAAAADGVHLGQDDLPLKHARRLLPADRLIGISAATIIQARQAEHDGADYLGVGSVFPTVSKPDAPVIGLARLRAIRRAVRLPIVAIGGITRDNAGAVRQAGADGIAVISAVFGAGDLERNIRDLS